MRARTVVAVGILAALAYAVPAQATVTETPGVVISAGHVDLGPRFVDGRWTVGLRDDTVDPAVWRPLDTVVLHVTGKARIAVPADPAYAFLGKPGQQVWVIPQVQQDGVIWPGWNTQDPEVEAQVVREVTWSLDSVEGPGVFTLFLNSDFGRPKPLFDSRDPFPQQTGIDVGTHVHGNWTFDTPGTYRLAITMTAQLKDNTTVTDRQTLTLHTGDAPPPTPQPRSATATAPADDSPATAVVVGGGGLVVLVIAGTVLVLRRRKTNR